MASDFFNHVHEVSREILTEAEKELKAWQDRIALAIRRMKAHDAKSVRGRRLAWGYRLLLE
jgi:hypothetical protein